MIIYLLLAVYLFPRIENIKGCKGRGGSTNRKWKKKYGKWKTANIDN